MEIVLDRMARSVVNLGWLVTHQFPLSAYREALSTATGKERTSAFKVAFHPDSSF